MKRSIKDLEPLAKYKIISRCNWGKEEDAILKKYVEIYKGKKWRLIAEAVNSDNKQNKIKTAKQCRERWHTHLDPYISSNPWSKEEKARVFIAHKTLGNKWSEIAKMFPGRTDSSIKNYFFCRLRKLIRSIKANEIPHNKSYNVEEIDQITYMLDHIYTYYISSENKANSVKTSRNQLHENKYKRDKYILDIISTEGPKFIASYNQYSRLFIEKIPQEIFELIITNYKRFVTHLLSISSNTDKVKSEFLESARQLNFPRDQRQHSESITISTNDSHLTLPIIVYSLKPMLSWNSVNKPSFDFSSYSSLIIKELLNRHKLCKI